MRTSLRCEPWLVRVHRCTQQESGLWRLQVAGEWPSGAALWGSKGPEQKGSALPACQLSPRSLSCPQSPAYCHRPAHCLLVIQGFGGPGRVAP